MQIPRNRSYVTDGHVTTAPADRVAEAALRRGESFLHPGPLSCAHSAVLWNNHERSFYSNFEQTQVEIK